MKEVLESFQPVPPNPRAPMAHATSVLLMAHGTPARLEELEAFLERVMGRLPSATMVETIRERYRAIGGHSPLLEITQRQATDLEAELGRQGLDIPVYIGMRHSYPLIIDAVTQMKERGVQQVGTLCLAPQYSTWSVGAYHRALHEALLKTDAKFSLFPVNDWHREPCLLDAFAEQLQKAMRSHAPDLTLFTAHSLPDVPEDDPYPRAIEDTAKEVARRVPCGVWRVAYQSRGLRAGHWLEPDVETCIRQAAHQGIKKILIAPIGFVSDHIEILYDIDILYRQIAQSVGIMLCRMASLNTHPHLIRAMAAAIRHVLPS